MKKYLFKFKVLFAANLLAVIAASAMNVSLAFVLKSIVDTGVDGDLGRFYRAMIFSITFTVTTFFVDYLKNVLQAGYLRRNLIELKKDIFNSILNRNMSSFTEENSAQYISLLTNDVGIIEQDYLKNILEMAGNITSFIIATAAIIMINPYIALGVFLVAGLMMLVPTIFGKKVSSTKKTYSDSLGVFTTKVKDIFSGFEVIKSFNIEEKIKGEYDKSNRATEDSKYSHSILNALVDTLSWVFGFLMFFMAMGLGTYFVITGRATLGSMIASVQLMNNIVNPLANISMKINRLNSARKIEEKLLAVTDENGSCSGIVEKRFFNEEIKFDGVDFSYTDNKKILNGISLNIKKGKKYAIVGASGSGKSTILKLLLRYYENFSGNIYIDGIENRDIRIEDIYRLVSVIQQNVFMFDTSIRENIGLFQNYSREEMERAIVRSGLENLIKSLPDGIESSVGENGCNLSGGEKQRIAIARALIKNTPILVLDEATSSLDNETSCNIEKALLAISELTTIVVTHKLMEDILKGYDEIIAVKDGIVVEIGDFKMLMEKKGYFYSLYSVA